MKHYNRSYGVIVL